MAWFRCGGTPSNVLALPTPSEASGAIARFNTDLTENLLSAVAEFSASQASGTPTPSAPIPIVGVDKVNVTRTGKNLFSSSFVIGSRANLTTGVFEPYTDGARTDYILIKLNMALTFSGFYNGFSSYFSYYDRNKNYISRSSSTPRTTATETPPTNACYVVVSYVKISGQTGDISLILNYNHQLELGSTATEYEPYNGTTALINLGGTYYGGSVDAVTGKITLTHEIETINPDNLGMSVDIFTYPLASMKSGNAQSGLCNRFAVVTSSGSFGVRFGANNSTIYFYKLKENISEITDLATAKTWFANNPVTVVYPLATPIEVYASNTAEIPTIVGDNQVYADTGDVAVKFFETVGHKI